MPRFDSAMIVVAVIIVSVMVALLIRFNGWG